MYDVYQMNDIQTLKQNETTWSTEVLAPSIAEESTSPANEKLVPQDSLC